MIALRVLHVHSASFRYTLKKATSMAEPPARNGEVLENVLVCFTCFERHDEPRIDTLIDQFIDTLKRDVERLQCNSVLRYPYAHLSKHLVNPGRARTFFDELQIRLLQQGFDAHKAPFGWYKTYHMECIGHPLSEAYREY